MKEFKEKLKKGKDINESKFHQFILSLTDDNMEMLDNYEIELKVRKTKSEVRQR